ncbi:MAG: hypothetical protein L0332_01480 [Chloroflexi bacterium]|nr:hypothetical protein [Chloroflexota bacterium]MCI0579517.1 hypothetical protein [Chloroflexota bacterium]MCI0644444.1 hypothetical protein [Chloroflexota bacterium]MCI0725392.1 hypothetical protein [Chloroflexota bacterium]
MISETLKQQLIDLFCESAEAHHRTYIATNGHNPEWPLWYAGNLCQPLSRLLGAAIGREELAGLLELVEERRLEENISTYWPEYYARFFMQRYLSAEPAN